MPQFVPVDHDPFAEAPKANQKLVPVDHDPFDKSYRGLILPLRTDKEGKMHPAVPRILEDTYEGLKEAVKAPGDVYSGKIPAGSPQMYEAARNVAGLIAGGGAGNAIEKETILPKASRVTEAGKAFEDMGINLKGAKSTRDTASGLIRDVPQVPETVAGKTGLPKTTGVPDQGLSDIGHSIYTDFLRKENAKNQLYAKAEALAKGAAYDFEPKSFEKINTQAYKLIEDSLSPSASDDAKKAGEFARDFLNTLGKPYQEAPSLTKTTIEKPGITTVKNIENETQYVPKVETTTKNPWQDTTTVRETPKGTTTTRVKAHDTSSKLTRGNKVSFATSDPFTVEKEVEKAAKNAPHRETLKSDVLQADKDLNGALRDLYQSNSGNKKLREFVKSAKEFIDTDLDRATQKGDNFSRMYQQARQSHKDIKSTYDTQAHGNDIAFLKKIGLDSDNLQSIKTDKGEFNPDAAKKLNAIPKALSDDSVEIGNQLKLLQPRVSPDAYGKILREKIKATVADNKLLNYEKAVEQKPMLTRLFRESDLPPAEQHRIVDNYISTAKQLKDTGLTGSPRTPLKQGIVAKTLGSVIDAASLATFGLLKSAAHSAAYGVKKLVNRGAEPENLYGLQKSLYRGPIATGADAALQGTEAGLRKLAGPEVGAQLGANISGNGNEPQRITIHPLKRGQQ